MSSLKSIIVKYVNSKKTMMWIIFVIIIFILATLYAYNYLYLPYDENKKFKNISNDFDKSAHNVIIYIFHVDWCPYCIKAMPEWNNFKSSMDGKLKNSYSIKCIDIDCTNNKDPEIKEFVDKYNIKGYPTVKMVKDDKVIDFDAKVTSDALTKFVNNMV